MFYPFNAKMVQNKTDIARVNNGEEEKFFLTLIFRLPTFTSTAPLPVAVTQ